MLLRYYCTALWILTYNAFTSASLHAMTKLRPHILIPLFHPILLLHRLHNRRIDIEFYHQPSHPSIASRQLTVNLCRLESPGRDALLEQQIKFTIRSVLPSAIHRPHIPVQLTLVSGNRRVR